MLQIDTLFINKNIFNPDSSMQTRNFGIWDLTRSSISYRNALIRIKKYAIIREEDQMRCDLLAFKTFGDSKYTGSILKTNSVSNPFSVKEGDFFLIPTKDGIDSTFDIKAKEIRSGSGTDNPNQKFRDSQEQKKFTVSNSRQKFLEQRAKAKNPTKQVLPPNVMQEGDRQTIRTNAVIGLAPDVSNATPDKNASV